MDVVLVAAVDLTVETPLSSKLFSGWRLSKRDAAGPAHCVGEPSPANNTSTRTGATRATENLWLHRFVRVAGWGDNVIVVVWYCVEVVVTAPAVESGDMSPVVQGSVNDA